MSVISKTRNWTKIRLRFTYTRQINAYTNQSDFNPKSIHAQMWIHSHKHENSKDSSGKIGAFLAVQFACMAKDSFWRSRCRCQWWT